MDILRIKVGTKFKVTVENNGRAKQIGTGIGEVISRDNNEIVAIMKGFTLDKVYFTLTCQAYKFKILKY